MAGMSISDVAHQNGVVVEVRKGKNVRHIMVSVETIFESFEAKSVCGRTIGMSDDDAIEIGTDLAPGKQCQTCGRTYDDMLTRQMTILPLKEAKEWCDENYRRMGEEEISTTPTAVSGMSFEDMRAAVAAYYAAGNPVPKEITSLTQQGGGKAVGVTPICDAPRKLGTLSDEDARARLNIERTHAKCLGCSAYIPLVDSQGDDEALVIEIHHAGGGSVTSKPLLKGKKIPIASHESVPGSPSDAYKRHGEEIKKHAKGKPVYRAKGNGGSYVHGGDYQATFDGVAGNVGNRDQGSVDGSANTGSANLSPDPRKRPKRGYLAKAGTMALPMTVKPGIDRGIQEERCPVPMCGGLPKRIAHAGKGAAWRRRHSKEVAAIHAEKRAAQERQEIFRIREGVAMPARYRRKLRKEASIGSSAEGTQAASGRVLRCPTVALVLNGALKVC